MAAVYSGNCPLKRHSTCHPQAPAAGIAPRAVDAASCLACNRELAERRAPQTTLAERDPSILQLVVDRDPGSHQAVDSCQLAPTWLLSTQVGLSEDGKICLNMFYYFI